MTSPVPGGTRDQLAEALAIHRYDAETRTCSCGAHFHPDYVDLHLAEDALLPTVERIATERAAEAWDTGYAAAQLDADEEPYSDRPERKTWQRRQNPHRAAALRTETPR